MKNITAWLLVVGLMLGVGVPGASARDDGERDEGHSGFGMKGAMRFMLGPVALADNEDLLAPLFVRLKISAITTGEARVHWVTNEKTTAKIVYGTTNPPSETSGTAVVDTRLRAEHKMRLAGLAANTRYYVQVVATDDDGNTTKSSVSSFTTVAVDITAPQIMGPFTIQVTDDDAWVLWATSERADSKVWASTSVSVATTGIATKGSAELVYFHAIRLTNLTASTTYHYAVGATDSAGNAATSGTLTFTTSAE